MESFKLFGFVPAMERRGEVLEVCRANGWKFVCMQPGKRYVIKVGMMKYYWTFEEVITNADLKKEVCLNGEGNNKADKNSLLAGGIGNKVSLVRYPRSI